MRYRRSGSSTPSCRAAASIPPARTCDGSSPSSRRFRTRTSTSRGSWAACPAIRRRSWSTVRRGGARSGRWALHVVPEHQLLRMRAEIHLLQQVAETEPPRVMTHERDRDDERQQAATIFLDDGGE